MILALFFIAMIYSSAGFGGGSLYISLLSQVFPGVTWIRLPALLCNAAVTAISSFNFARSGWIPYRPVLQLLAVSLPLTIWAASWEIPAQWFLLILGAMLVLAGGALIVRQVPSDVDVAVVQNPWWLYPVVAIIGLLSGITGIGGGIYLSPFLHHTKWANAKAIAATTAFFILVNSTFSLAVLLWRGVMWQNEYFTWIAAVMVGGWLGSRMSIRWLHVRHLRILTALILMFVGTKIGWDHWSNR